MEHRSPTVGHDAAEALCALAAAHLTAGRKAEGGDLAEEALRRYSTAEPQRWQVEARSMLGAVRRHQARHQEAATLAREAIDLARRLGAPDLEGTAHNNLALVLSTLGEHDQALSHYLEALAVIEPLDTEESTRLRMFLNANVADLHAEAGDHLRAAEHLSSALELARRVTDAKFVVLMGRKRAVCLRRANRRGDARQQLEEILPLMEQSVLVGGSAAQCLAELAVLDDDRVAAEAHYRRAIEQERTSSSDRQNARLGLDLAAVLDPRSDEAHALALAACRLAHAETGCGALELDALELLAVQHEARGDLAAALRCVREAATLQRALFDLASHRRQDELEARFDLAQRSWEASWHRTQNQALVQRVDERTRELQDANQRLLVARDRAEAADRMKSGFLAAVSHELRTPLNAIIGYGELIREELHDPDPSDLLPCADRILDSAAQLLGLVDRILQLTNLDAGATRIQAAPVHLPGLVDEVVQAVGRGLVKRGNTFAWSCEPDLAPHTDGTLLRAVLFNLVENADKFTADGEVRVSAGREGELLVVSVSDTGIGMSAGEISRLFQPFTQIETGSTRRFGGLGLGLALARRYCQLLGGALAVQSEAGRGTLFQIRIPFDLPAAWPTAP